MKEPHAPSRDDFPMNAFSLLPPSIVGAKDEPGDHVVMRVAPEDPVEVEERDVQVDAAGENPLVLLQLSLAHTELRDTIEALYHIVDMRAKETATLRQENERLVESQERGKLEAAKVVEKMQEILRARDHEVMQMQQDVRQLRSQKDHLHSELTEIQLELEERKAAISDLEGTIRELHEKQERFGDSLCHDAELRCLIDTWATKERSVAENTEHVRGAVTGVQRLAQQLQNQLNEVQSELQTAEKQHEEFRGYLTYHRCAHNSDHVDSSCENTARLDELHEMKKRVTGLEAEILEATTEIKVLQTKCKEYKKSIRTLSSQNEHARAKEVTNRKLITKYLESAVDGTQTISDLQESLVKLCDQLAQERKEHLNRQSEIMEAALKSETSLRQEVNDLREKLKEAIDNLDTLHKPSTVTRSSAQCANSQQLVKPHTLPNVAPNGGGLHSSSPSSHLARLQSADSRSAFMECDGSNGSIQVTVQEAIDDVAHTPERIRSPAQGKRSRRDDSREKDKKRAISCRLCGEEPFGFMVRCQKCKDPFHAGCVKNNGDGPKKRLGHIFKCSNCAPHRPTKVTRRDGCTNRDNERAPTHGFGAPPLEVTASRNTGVVTRPALPDNIS